jgi:hypothetical protein
MFLPSAEYGYLMLITSVIAIFVSFIVYSRDRKYILNILVGSALFFFSLLLSFESVMYIFQINDLQILNLLRDLSLISSRIALVLIFLSALVLKNGPDYLKSNRIIITLLIFLLFLSESVVVFIENVDFELLSNNESYLVFKGNLLTIILDPLVNAIVLIITIFFYFQKYNDFKKSDPVVARRIFFLIASLIAIFLSALWFGVLNTVYADSVRPIELLIIGHLLYLIGASLSLISFAKKATAS